MAVKVEPCERCERTVDVITLSTLADDFLERLISGRKSLEDETAAMITDPDRDPSDEEKVGNNMDIINATDEQIAEVVHGLTTIREEIDCSMSECVFRDICPRALPLAALLIRVQAMTVKV